MNNPIIGMIHNVTADTFHPVLFLYNPLPGGEAVGKQDRHKSKGHHTEGFKTREEAEKQIAEQLVPDTEKTYGTPKLSLKKMFPWDGKGVPAMVVFFGESDGEVVPMF